MRDLTESARRIIDGNRYLTLGTSDPDVRPRLSPVYFSHGGYQRFYWVSRPEATHSRQLAARPAVSLVIYDSTVDVGRAEAVYVDADAAMVPDAELEAATAEAFAAVAPGATGFTPEQLSGASALRLYRAVAIRHEILITGRDPEYGEGYDRRQAITL
jgi:nitroimidazol reductase NimA-like FMN-containing flavoprotein (pyridoxamine 5'-phosphate oxidase superfamily)